MRNYRGCFRQRSAEPPETQHAKRPRPTAIVLPGCRPVQANPVPCLARDTRAAQEGAAEAVGLTCFFCRHTGACMPCSVWDPGLSRIGLRYFVHESAILATAYGPWRQRWNLLTAKTSLTCWDATSRASRAGDVRTVRPAANRQDGFAGVGAIRGFPHAAYHVGTRSTVVKELGRLSAGWGFPLCSWSSRWGVVRKALIAFLEGLTTPARLGRRGEMVEVQSEREPD